MIKDWDEFFKKVKEQEYSKELRVFLDPKTGMLAIETKDSGFVKEFCSVDI